MTTPTQEQIAEAVEHAVNAVHYCNVELGGKMFCEIGHSGLTYNDIETLIQAAEETERLSTLLMDRLDENINLRARIAELEKDRPEVVTVERFRAEIWGLQDAEKIIQQTMEFYPNGLCVVQDKECG